MKNILSILFIIICLFSTSAAIAAPQSVGKVIALVGVVSAEQDGTKRALELRSDIYPKDIITSGNRGKAQIMFNDDTLLSIAPKTELSIDNYVFDSTNPSSSDFLVNCATGMLEFATGDIVKKNPDGFKFETPLNVIGIRGTNGGLIVGPAGGATPPACTALLFHSSKPSNMSVLGKATGGLVQFSEFGQMIRQQTPQRIQPPAPIPADVMNTFRKGTAMPTNAFTPKSEAGGDKGKADGDKSKKNDDDQGGNSGDGEKDSRANNNAPTPVPVAKGPNVNQLVDDDLSNALTQSAETQAKDQEQSNRIVPEEGVEYIMTSTGISGMTNDGPGAAGTAHTNGIVKAGDTMELTATGSTSNPVTNTQTASITLEDKDLDGNYDTITNIKVTLPTDSAVVNEQEITHSLGTPQTGTNYSPYMSWGYWQPSTPTGQIAGSGLESTNIYKICFAKGEINTNVSDYSGTYTGQVRAVYQNEVGTPTYRTGNMDAEIFMDSDGNVSVIDSNITVSVSSSRTYKARGNTGGIQDGQFVLSGGTHQIVDTYDPSNPVDATSSNIQGAVFKGDTIGGTFSADFKDTGEQISGSYAAKK
ncbi:MAG: FecR family protein [Desulfovibrio sp.]